MDRSARFKPLAEGNVPSGGTEAPAIDARARLIVTTAAGAPVIVTGAVTPADNFVNPTDAVTTWSLVGGLDAAGTWDRLRVRPWPTTAAAQTASASALDVIGMMVGPDGAGNLVSAFVDAGGNQRVAGAVTPADNVTTRTDCVPTAANMLATDPAGTQTDRLRCRPWTAAVGTQTASVAALDVFAQLCGANGLGGISDVAVTASNQLRVSFAPNGPSAVADNVNFAGQVLEYAGVIPSVRTQTTLPSAYTDARWTPPNADAYAQQFTMDGRPANNARNAPSGTFLTAGGGDSTIANAPVVLRWLDVVNLDTTTTIVYAQLHNVAGAVGAGAVPVLSFPIGPGGVGSTVTNLAARFTQAFGDVSGGGGLRFSTGLHIAISSTAATYTAVGTTVQVNASYYT